MLEAMSASHTSIKMTPLHQRLEDKQISRRGDRAFETLVAPVRAGKKESERHKTSHAKLFIEYRNIDPAVETALYYGFTPLPAPLLITKKDKDAARGIDEEIKSDIYSITPMLEERIAMLRYAAENGLKEEQPAMFCAEVLTGPPIRRKADQRRLLFDIIGTRSSIADATLIQTALATLRECAHENLTLSINSVGDRESMSQFVRELGNYYRKHVTALPQSCKTQLKKSPFELLTCAHPECRALFEEAPKPMGFLGDESRRHFREVLEFLEELEIPYKIDHALGGNRSFANETIFDIRETMPDGTSQRLSYGMRYDNLGKRLGLRSELPSVGVNVLLVRDKRERKERRAIRFKKPLVFLLQLGFYAKLKSLRVIEMLRKAHIPLHQALCRDKLVSQLSVADRLKIPYSIILGQREALENCAIIRNTETRAQETVRLDNLVEHLKKMKIG